MVLRTDAFDRHLARPFLQRLQLLRERVADATDELGRNAQLDQYPARRVPQIYTRLFGPITGPIVARRSTATAQENTGTLATPDVWFTPKNGPLILGRDGCFVCTRMVAHGYMSLTWASDPTDLPTAVHPWGTGRVGDLFDDVVRGNGGGLLQDQFAYAPIALNAVGGGAGGRIPVSSFAWRMGLYDQKLDRYMHDGDSLPSSVFAGGAATSKLLAADGRFEETTIIEPRLYVDELSLSLNISAADMSAIQMRAWLSLSLVGFLEQNQDRGIGRSSNGEMP